VTNAQTVATDMMGARHPLNVLHVAAGIEPDAGGPPVSILNFIRCSSSADVRPTLLVTVDPSTSGAERGEMRRRVEDAAGHLITAKRIGFFGSKAKRWAISPSLAFWIARHVREYDLVVLHSAWLFSSIAGLCAARLAHRTCVMVPHESLTEFDVERPGNHLRRMAKRILKRLYLRQCDLIIFASVLERDDTVPAANVVKATVLHHPIVNASLLPRARPARVPGQPLRLGFLGRLHPKKNVPLLLDALSELDEHTVLVVGGDGPDEEKERLRSRVLRLGVTDRVIWRGFVSQAQKQAFFDGIDLLVMPSEYESFGLVAAEAMAQGVPVVVTPRSGVAEIVRAHGGGVVCRPEREPLIETLRQLEADREKLARLAASAIEAVRLELGYEQFGTRLRQEYFKLMDREVARGRATAPSLAKDANRVQSAETVDG
jgi:glycosyltransferase involved in cell wall biosynthesis